VSDCTATGFSGEGRCIESASVGSFCAEHGARLCDCVGYTIRTDYGTGIEYDLDRSSCPVHADA
jgi:hypothetical protein